MVDAIHIISVALGAAFLLGLIKERRGVAYAITLLAFAAVSAIAGQWVWALGWNGAAPVDIFTAGVEPPFAIALRMSLAEAVLILLINLTGLLSLIYLRDTMFKQGRRAMAVLLIFAMALGGMVLTRDLFNLFVFIELIVISTGGLILLSHDQRALGAGFKYLIVAQLISLLLLIGVIFAYHATGTLNIDDLSGMSATIACLASVGPGLGKVGPSQNYAFVPGVGKGLLSFCMIAGRLEIFALLAAFTPECWRR